jgi:hypothetical protein
MSRSFKVFFVFWALITSMQARLAVNPAVVDISRDLLPDAKIIFRGRVLDLAENPGGRVHYTATFKADRWYRGTPIASPTLSFDYNNGGFREGHDCIFFQPNSYWILFATIQQDGTLKLVHDCHGALAVSQRTAPDVSPPRSMIEQMEADFEAGVEDTDPAARLVSVQRLGNLKLAEARPVLHRSLDSCTDAERPWVVLAALRTGDVSVLPAATTMLSTWRLRAGGEPQGLIALELKNLTDPGAVTGLIEILRTAPETLVKSCALQALGDRLRDARALDQISAFLGDPDKFLNWDALVGMWNITHAPACSLQHWTEQEIPAITRSCKSWWESEGKKRTWE